MLFWGGLSLTEGSVSKVPPSSFPKWAVALPVVILANPTTSTVMDFLISYEFLTNTWGVWSISLQKGGTRRLVSGDPLHVHQCKSAIEPAMFPWCGSFHVQPWDTSCSPRPLIEDLRCMYRRYNRLGNDLLRGCLCEDRK